MGFLDSLQNLDLPPMLAATFVLSLALAWVVTGTVRLGVRRSGFNPATPLPIRDTLIGATSAVFALTLAFCAAGIWNDTVQARSTVQREAQALENLLALSKGLPPALQREVRDDVSQYVQRVVASEWPAMAHRLASDAAVYSQSDRALLRLIDALAGEAAKSSPSSATAAALSQLFEVRSARLARLTVAESGVTPAQWTALFLLALSALLTVALVHNHHFGSQLVAMHLYAAVVTATFFLILAHDRPFVGELSVPPTPLQQLVARTNAELAPAIVEAEPK